MIINDESATQQAMTAIGIDPLSDLADWDLWTDDEYPEVVQPVPRVSGEPGPAPYVPVDQNEFREMTTTTPAAEYFKTASA